MGCDRPFVEQERPEIEIIAPDLSEAVMDDSITLQIQASSFRDIERVIVNGKESTYDAQAGVWRISVPASDIITRYIITAFDVADTAGRDTVYSAHLEYATFTDVQLPLSRGAHTATNLGAGVVLVTGGAPGVDNPAISNAALVHTAENRVEELDASLIRARAGHTATPLPDGRALLLGGATIAAPQTAADLVSAAEFYNPSTREFQKIAVDGPPVRRAFHTATTYESSAGTIIAVYGGLGEGVGSQGADLELRADLRRFLVEEDTLVALDAAAGVLTSFGSEVAWQSQTPFSSTGREGDLIAGAVSVTGAESSVGFILEQASTGEIRSAPAPGLLIDRKQHAAVELQTAVVLFAAGRAVPGETLLNSLSIYGIESEQYFIIPEQGAIPIKRYAHTATKLPSERILLIGGFSSSGASISTSVLIRPFQE